MALNTGEDQAKIRGGFQKLATRPSLLLNDGDMIGSLRAVAAPGHTPGHMAFFDERNGALIAGDAFQTLGGVAVAGVLRPLFPLPALATWSLPTALETARKLRALNPRLLAIGHGRMLEGPLAAIDAAIATAEDKARGMATRGA
jgi:glyoxylase-like metal-dependent hydrolase (beta-lactamase superfamily II)